MRKSREEAAQSRKTIVEAASALFRARGLGVGLADVMAAAGMTHGGFYRHFASKEALVAEVLEQALDERSAILVPGENRSPREALRDYVALYLSEAHVDHPELGCPIAAVGAEAGRTDSSARTLASGAERLAARFAADLGIEPAEARRRALAMLASMVGAVVVARAVGESPLRAETLAALRAEPAFRDILEG
jgi:TetR/AcrR family transcriptional regulator, transcriptional repressor for nem operon